VSTSVEDLKAFREHVAVSGSDTPMGGDVLTESGS
jgi:hypothetical protein